MGQRIHQHAMKKTTLSVLAIAQALLALAVDPAKADIIFSDDFDGDTSDLNGTTPDITTNGAAWVACPAFKKDGSIEPNFGSATLAYTPVDGFVYTLDVSLRGVVGDSNWIGVGFANGQSTGTTANDRFITGNLIGTAWALFRGDASVNLNQSWLGTGVGNGGGTQDSSSWTGPLAGAMPGGDVDIRIVLDTSGGAGTWTASWLARRPIDAEYTVMRPATLMLTESMNSVGIALSRNLVDGIVESFTLSSVSSVTEKFKITGIVRDSGTGNVTLTFESVLDRIYNVETSTNLVDWNLILASEGGSPQAVFGGAGLTTDFTDSNPPAGGQVFYRVIDTGLDD